METLKTKRKHFLNYSSFLLDYLPTYLPWVGWHLQSEYFYPGITPEDSKLTELLFASSSILAYDQELWWSQEDWVRTPPPPLAVVQKWMSDLFLCQFLSIKLRVIMIPAKLKITPNTSQSSRPVTVSSSMANVGLCICN